MSTPTRVKIRKRRSLAPSQRVRSSHSLFTTNFDFYIQNEERKEASEIAVAREEPINFSQFVNKTAVINIDTPLAEQGGFYCKDCECVLKDSANYLDHLNSKKRNLFSSISLFLQLFSLIQTFYFLSKRRFDDSGKRVETQEGQNRGCEEQTVSSQEEEGREEWICT